MTAHGRLEGAGLVVRRFSQDGQESRDFDFAAVSCPPGMREALMQAFIRRTAPGTKAASMSSMGHAFRAARQFACYVAALPRPPREASQLTPEHFDGYCAHRKALTPKSLTTQASELRSLLVCMEDVTAALAARLAGDLPRRVEGPPRESYSRGEFKRTAAAARAVLRAAAKRIRDNRELLRQWREGELVVAPESDLGQRLAIMEHVERLGDVPRAAAPDRPRAISPPPLPWVAKRGRVQEMVTWLHLSARELAAAAVLLAVMTGENPEVIVKAPAAHHRADGFTGGPGTALVDLHKPRRGWRAWMSLALSQFPDWISIPDDPQVSARDELHTPFGLYVLLHELTAGSRTLVGGKRLLVGYYEGAGRRHGRGLRPMDPNAAHLVRAEVRTWGLTRDEPDAYGSPVALLPTLSLLRLTHIELNQKPVAHTAQTAATSYLARNRGNVTEYRQVVARALSEEVAKARARRAVAVMSTADVQRALTDLNAVAVEQGVDPATLTRMLQGKLDTVMVACTDNNNGPQTPGQPCRASFMLCLECECARALPHHLPVQVLIHDRLTERRTQMDTLRWARRFAGPHARLADLLGQHDATAVADARTHATTAQHALADRFLNRELDQR